MKKKLTTMMFCLLLAAGWTMGVQAQLLPGTKGKAAHRMRVNCEKSGAAAMDVPQPGAPEDHVFMAPLRTPYTVTADEVRTRSFFETELDPLTWTGVDGTTQTTLLTVPYTDPNGMMALIERIYTDEDIPGIQYSYVRSSIHPYYAIDFGWDIPGGGGTLTITTQDPTCVLASITIEDVTGHNTLIDWWFEDEDYELPEGWTTSSPLQITTIAGFGGVYMDGGNNTGGTITIPLEPLNNPTSAYRINFYAVSSGSGYAHHVFVPGATYGGQINLNPGSWKRCGYIYVPASIKTPPKENGYTTLLVKLKDGVNEDINARAPQFTHSEQELRDFFSTYVDEIQLLTDGLRVGEGSPDAGTMFAYTGTLNKFFFISKGKLCYATSSDYPDIFYSVDWAPFYSMFEEFSPVIPDDIGGFDDYYLRMKELGEFFPIEHDCESVIYQQHYFSMTGKTGHDAYNMNCLVFYIPDNRGKRTSREYQQGDTPGYQIEDPNDHMPGTGLYVATLDAEERPSDTDPENFYTVDVTWETNLNEFASGAIIPQTYYLYEIYDRCPHDGVMDTTLVYVGEQTYWPFEGDPNYNPEWPHDDYPLGEEGQCPETSYPITYYVIATPTGATNPDTFFAKSNDDDVLIPAKNDFMGVKLLRYESDYVIDDEVNYYRNFIAPRNLADRNITASSVGEHGRTLVLYRGEDAVIYLDLMMDQGKAYYRFRYDKQVRADGYDETGNKGNNNSNN